MIAIIMYAITGRMAGGSSDAGGMAVILMFFALSVSSMALVGLVTSALISKEAQGMGDVIKASVVSGSISYLVVFILTLLFLALTEIGHTDIVAFISIQIWMFIMGMVALVEAIPFVIIFSVIGSMVYLLFLSRLTLGKLLKTATNKWFLASAIISGVIALCLPIIIYTFYPSGSPGIETMALLLFTITSLFLGALSTWPLKCDKAYGKVWFASLFTGLIVGLAWSCGSVVMAATNITLNFYGSLITILDMVAIGLMFGFIGAMFLRAIANYRARPSADNGDLPECRSLYANALHTGLIIGIAMLLLTIVPALISFIAVGNNPSGKDSFVASSGTLFGCLAIMNILPLAAIFTGVLSIRRAPVKCLEDAIDGAAISSTVYGLVVIFIIALDWVIMGYTSAMIFNPAGSDLMIPIYSSISFVLKVSPIIMVVMVFLGIVSGAIYGAVIRKLKPQEKGNMATEKQESG